MSLAFCLYWVDVLALLLMQILFPFTKFPNVLTHFVPSLCILVNIFMNMKLLYNQPSEVYPFKVTHLVDSLI